MWRRIQMIFALVILIYIAGVTGPSKLPEGSTDPVAAKVSNFIQVVVIPPFLLLLVVNRRKIFLGLRASFFPMLVSTMVVLSTVWSIEPRITLRRGVIFMFVSLFGVYMGSCLSLKEHIEMYGKMVLVTIVGCYLIAILLPEYGISSDVHSGEWKGLFQHKNILGRQMAFCFALLLGGKPFRSIYLRWTAIGATLVLLALSRSGTGLLGVLAVIAAYFVVKIIRVRNRRTLPLWLALAPIGTAGLLAALIFRDSIFAILGKDSTLTGRTRIWEVAFRGMAESPWLGHGYNTYWRQSIIGRSLPQGLLANHSHDGYFDIVLDIGYIGMAVFIIALLTYVVRTMKPLVQQQLPLANFTVFAFLFVAMFVGLNFTESNLLREHTFLWLPFISIYTALGMQGSYQIKQLTATESVIKEESLVHQMA